MLRRLPGGAQGALGGALRAGASRRPRHGGEPRRVARIGCGAGVSGPDGEPGLTRTSVDGVVNDGLDVGGPTTRSSSKASAALRNLQGLNMWHSITTEPGCDKVSMAVAAWIAEEATRARSRT